MRRLTAFLTIFLLVLAGCKSSKNPEQKFFDEVSTLSKEQAVAKGDQLSGKKRWEEARKYYSFIADSFPNDPLGRKAALKVGDTFFAGKDVESLTEASIRFKDFSNRFPSDPGRGYALLMLGKCSFQQRKGPLRDLASLREAAESFRQVVKLYPETEFAKEAQQLLADATEDLASHELLIAQFYARLGAWEGARLRVDYLLANYPESKAASRVVPLAEEIKARFASPTATPLAPGTPAPTATAPPQHPS